MVARTGVVLAPDGYATAGVAAVAALALLSSRKVPAALVLFRAGLVLAAWDDPAVVGSLRLGVSLPRWDPPGWEDVVHAFPKAALPQIPLTTLNSVVAVSVGLMNLVSAGFGGMPMCHGAGGLAG